MKAKQKARELIKVFNSIEMESPFYIMSENQVKQAAIKCVDELMNQSRSFDYNLYVSRLEYLEEVKYEIEKI